MIKILFVCMGNICRSPTAEGVFRRLVEKAGLTDRILVDSAGTHEGFGLLENFVRIDEQFADVRLEVIPDGPDHQTAFQIDEEGAGLLGSSAFYGAPQLQQVVQVPLQLFRAAADGGGTGDQAHGYPPTPPLPRPSVGA